MTYSVLLYVKVYIKIYKKIAAHVPNLLMHSVGLAETISCS